MTSTTNKKQLEEVLGEGRVCEQELFRIGQKDFEAELYTEVLTIDELVKVVTQARQHAISFQILGIGFFPEASSIEGLVIKNSCRKFDILSMRGKVNEGLTERSSVLVSAETGVGLNQLTRFTLDQGLGGLESFLGVSGTVGDGLVTNLYYEKHKDYLTSHVFTLRFLTKENEVVEVGAEPFLYPFETNMMSKKQVIPLSVVFNLIPGDKTDLWKKGTQAAFERNQSDLLDPLKGNFTY